MLNQTHLQRLLQQVADGVTPIDQALATLRSLPFEATADAHIDHHRQLRDGLGEVVYCEGKTADQVADIVSRLAATGQRVLATRASCPQYEAARRRVAGLEYDMTARAMWLDRHPVRPRRAGIVVVAAGTSDLPVTDETCVTLRLMGHEPHRIVDVGVAGVHRLLQHVRTLQDANVIVAVAGMDAALPTVVAGLVGAAVIGVPTSIGYGASFHGLAALLSMLNSCAAGVAVVNIDNGFGAGYLAAIINEKMAVPTCQTNDPLVDRTSPQKVD